MGATLASDDASAAAYLDGWQAGDNGGMGFGPWSFDYSGVDVGLFHDPQFIDRGPLAANSLGAPAFGLTTSNRRFFTDTSEVRRTFATPLGIGHTFSLHVDGSVLDLTATPFTIGNTIRLFASDGSERFGLFTNNQYHNNSWTATGNANTSVPAESAFRIEFTLVTADTYDLALLPIGGGAPLFAQTGAVLHGTAGAAINRLRISNYGTGSSANGSNELFFDNLSITSAGLDGDYNQNGIVDAADYVVWRDTLGQTGADFAADGNGDNRIDAADYDFWKTHFNETAGASGYYAQTIPEPTTWLLLLTSNCCLVIFSIANRTCRYKRMTRFVSEKR